MKPGIYHDLPSDEYHSGPGVSNSGLSLISRSPLHYWSRYLDPQREADEPTPAFELGSAVHCAVLEPDRFATDYVVVPADAPRKPTSAQLNAKKPSDDTVAAIEWWDDFNAKHASATILSDKDYRKCLSMASAMQAHDMAEIVFADGDAEVSIFWEDAETGVLCKIRPDWLMRTAIFDLKTTEDASPSGFVRSVMNYRYYQQAAFYLDGARAAGLDVDAFMFGAIEKSAPFAASVYYADGDMIEAGRQEYRRLIRVYADCLSSNRWPGYSSQIVPLSLPAWYKTAEPANDNRGGV